MYIEYRGLYTCYYFLLWILVFDCFINDLEFFPDTLQEWIIASFIIKRAAIKAFMRPGGVNLWFDVKGACSRGVAKTRN